MKQIEQLYRDQTVSHSYNEKFNSMNYEFIPMVYMRDTISEEELENYLKSEYNPLLKKLAEDCAPELEGLFYSMSLVMRSLQHAYWFVFFSDMFKCNSDLEAFSSIATEFDYKNEASILYKMCSR